MVLLVHCQACFAQISLAQTTTEASGSEGVPAASRGAVTDKEIAAATTRAAAGTMTATVAPANAAAGVKSGISVPAVAAAGRKSGVAAPALAATGTKSGAAAPSNAAAGPKFSKGSYQKQEAVSDPAGSSAAGSDGSAGSPTPGVPKRIHRPGTDAVTDAAESAFPSKAPPIGSPGNPMPLLKAPPVAPPREKFPSVGQLEEMMFGHSNPNIIVENRLDKLEIAIFQKSSPDLDIERRIHRLKEVIVGTDTTGGSSGGLGSGLSPSGAGTYGSGSSAYGTGLGNPAGAFPPGTGPYSASPVPTAPDKERTAQLPFFENIGNYDLNQVLTLPEAEKFGAEIINEVRSAQGLNDVQWDDLGHKIASEQAADLCKRGAVSHQNEKGHNPDLRYSFAGGTDSIVESAVAFNQAENLKPTRQLVVKMLEALYQRQDDREALMFPHANGFAMSFKWNADRSKLICVTETLTKHSEMEPIPLEVSVGDRIEVKGKIKEPFQFHKLTVAWEGPVSPPTGDAESEEALPYFPPLDYEAHAVKSSRDFEKGIRFLQIAGITAAIAGGLFIPPVALAAPLIAASVGATTPKPVSEIPVRGGVKTDGSSFTHRVPLSNQGKDGIYYVTVWVKNGTGNEMLPISRRAIIARKDMPDEANNNGGSPKDPPGKTDAADYDPVAAKARQTASENDDNFEQADRKNKQNKKAQKKKDKLKDKDKKKQADLTTSSVPAVPSSTGASSAIPSDPTSSATTDGTSSTAPRATSNETSDQKPEPSSNTPPGKGSEDVGITQSETPATSPTPNLGSTTETSAPNASNQTNGHD